MKGTISALAVLQPHVLWIENVPELAHGGENESGLTWVIGEMTKQGYVVHVEELDLAELMPSHHRKRPLGKGSWGLLFFLEPHNKADVGPTAAKATPILLEISACSLGPGSPLPGFSWLALGRTKMASIL